jgi:hypothetical protein
MLPVRAEDVAGDELLLAHVYAGDERTIRVYIRSRTGKLEVVGLQRRWASRDAPRIATRDGLAMVAQKGGSPN